MRTIRDVILLCASAVALLVGFVLLAPTVGAQRQSQRGKPSGVSPFVLEPKGTPSSGEDSGNVSVVVVLEDAPLARRPDLIRRAPGAGREARRPDVRMPAAGRGAARPDFRGPEAVRYRAFLREKQAAVERSLYAMAPRARVGQRLDVVLNSISVAVPPNVVAHIRNLPGVKAVYADNKQQLQTTHSPAYIGAPAVWEETGGDGRAGEGMIIGVVDSGVWPEHPSLSDPSPGGGPYSPPEEWSGTACEFGSSNPADGAFACNNKLIGAQRIMATYDSQETLLPDEFQSARDDSGHGTYAATIAAGNSGVAASIVGNSLGIVSGVAPGAHVAVYKVCGNAGCYDSDAAAAVEQAVLDGVDVITLAVSGGTDPYSDVLSLALLEAYNAGVFVAAAAGNDGLGAIGGRQEPWVMAVGASTIGRSFHSTVTLRAGASVTTITGVSVTNGISNMTPILNAADVGDPYCVAGSPAGTFSGRVVVCMRGGGNTSVAKSANVQQRGGVAMILANATPLLVSTDTNFIPTIQLEKSGSDALFAFLGANSGETASFTSGAAASIPGDLVASFTSRGGGSQALGVLKPDVAAPGVQILAGHTPRPATPQLGPSEQMFIANSGTSASSAHVAGAGALLKSLNPWWGPGHIKSALMLTANPTLYKQAEWIIAVPPFPPVATYTNASPWDMGSGRVQLAAAARPGIAITPADGDFMAMKSHLWDVNYPSLNLPAIPGVMQVERTIENLESNEKIWDVTALAETSDVTVTVPTQIVLPPNGSATLSIVVDAHALPVGFTKHTWIVFREQEGDRVLVFPITLVRKENSLPILTTCLPSTIRLNTVSTCEITVGNISTSSAATTIYDELPPALQIVPGSVTNATQYGNAVVYQGTLAPANPNASDVRLASYVEPFFSISPYFAPLQCAGSCDNQVFTGAVPAGVLYDGVMYSSVSMSTNGFVQLGGSSGASPVNQVIPDAAAPHNVLAAFWTDLHPAGTDGQGAGQLYAGYLLYPDGMTWLVFEWKDVRAKGSTQRYTFQIWLHVGTRAQEMAYLYGRLDGSGANGSVTVGAENATGTGGDSYYANGAGVFPRILSDLIVSPGKPSPGGTRTLRFQVRGTALGTWQHCGVVVSNLDSTAAVLCRSIVVKR